MLSSFTCPQISDKSRECQPCCVSICFVTHCYFQTLLLVLSSIYQIVNESATYTNVFVPQTRVCCFRVWAKPSLCLHALAKSSGCSQVRAKPGSCCPAQTKPGRCVQSRAKPGLCLRGRVGDVSHTLLCSNTFRGRGGCPGKPIAALGTGIAIEDTAAACLVYGNLRSRLPLGSQVALANPIGSGQADTLAATSAALRS